MRIVKKHDDRKNEILDAAEKLFYSKGYEHCTVNDILKEVGIAKGTFYHYFISKEGTLDAIVERNIDIMVSRIKKATDNNDLPVQKLMNVFLAMKMDGIVDRKMLDDLHKCENALLHQKNLSHMIESITPVLVGIIEEGIEKNVWSCRYPLQYMKIFLAASLTLTDEGICNIDADSQLVMMVSLISLLEKMLEVPENSFLGLYQQTGT